MFLFKGNVGNMGTLKEQPGGAVDNVGTMQKTSGSPASDVNFVYIWFDNT